MEMLLMIYLFINNTNNILYNLVSWNVIIIKLLFVGQIFVFTCRRVYFINNKSCVSHCNLWLTQIIYAPVNLNSCIMMQDFGNNG